MSVCDLESDCSRHVMIAMSVMLEGSDERGAGGNRVFDGGSERRLVLGDAPVGKSEPHDSDGARRSESRKRVALLTPADLRQTG
jgi:hypothetical protein